MRMLSFTSDDHDLLDSANVLLIRWDIQLYPVTQGEAELVARKEIGSKSWSLQNQGDTIQLTYSTRVSFFKALAIAFTCGQFPLSEERTPFKQKGVLLDCSRNAVFSVSAVKELITSMAMLGLDTLYLYIEDLYQVQSLPYFGYQRGRYTPQEIKQIEDSCKAFGISLVPAIQTLAHLRTALHWEYARPLRDTDDILMVGSDKVTQFLDKLIGAVAAQFSSDTIHIGMDESEMLGLGNYLKQNGYIDAREIFNQHLETVVQLCKNHGKKPMVWSDMFRKLSQNGIYTPAIAKEVEICYWDYYHRDESFYAEQLKQHKQISKRLCSATGAWTWNGISPNYSLAKATIKAMTDASRSQGLDQVICTLWFDDGAETPLQTGYPMLAYFSYHTSDFSKGLTLNDWFSSLFRMDWNDFMLLDAFDHLPGGTVDNASSDNPSKWFLYQDPLLGLFETYGAVLDTRTYYAELGDKLEHLKTKNPHFSLVFSYYHQLAIVLSQKANIGLDIRSAYTNDDRQCLERIATQQIPKLIEEVVELRRVRRNLWFSEAKGPGFEVLDTRYSAIVGRLETTIWRIGLYLNKSIDELDELNDTPLAFREREQSNTRRFTACNRWQEIITAGII